MLPVMLFLGVGKGWQCQLCQLEYKELSAAVRHADGKHGAESTWNDEMDIYNGKDPDVLRATGRL